MDNTNLISDSYLKLRELMASPVLNIAEFSSVISQDAGMASMVLRLANREILGFNGRINSINQAIELLGMGQVSEIVLEAMDMLAVGLMLSTPKANNVIPFPVSTTWRATTLCA